MRDAQVDVDIIGARTAGLAAYRAVRGACASATVSSGSFCATSNAIPKTMAFLAVHVSWTPTPSRPADIAAVAGTVVIATGSRPTGADSYEG